MTYPLVVLAVSFGTRCVVVYAYDIVVYNSWVGWKEAYWLGAKSGELLELLLVLFATEVAVPLMLRVALNAACLAIPPRLRNTKLNWHSCFRNNIWEWRCCRCSTSAGLSLLLWSDKHVFEVWM